MLDRRAFLAGMGGVVVTPLLAKAQPAVKTPRIGLLLTNSRDEVARNPRGQAFLQGLRDVGWIEGQTLAIERRYADGQVGRLADLATELVGLKVDVIVAAAAPAARAAKNATSSIPVVIIDPGDPVGSGLVASLAHPGGNVTGVTSIAPELAAKRLGTLREAAPGIARVATLFNAAIPPAEIAIDETLAAARMLGLRVQSVPVHGPEGFTEAFATIVRDRLDALVVFPDPTTFAKQEAIVSFASANRIPALFGAKEFVEVGGLMSYGPSYPAMFRRAAYYVDRILKGAKPVDLPIEQPTKFELVINLKTAKALGLTIPQSLLLRADQIIQ
jgi:putative ABC transport system substrate-binding protein